MQARSLLTSHEDFTTLMFHNSQEILKPGFVWAHLKRHLPEAVVEEVQRLTLTKDNMAAVFDVPSKRARVSSADSKIHKSAEANSLLYHIGVW